MAPHLGEERARVRNDVAGRAPRDDADVRTRLRVDTAQAEVRDGARRGGDRRAPVLGNHARMRRAAAERHLERDGRRRAEHDLADRRRLVVHVAELGLQPRAVEGVRAAQADLLLRREERARGRRAVVLRRARGALPRPSPPRRPCCRRRGSSPQRCGRGRPRRQARSAPAAAPCRGVRRGRSASRSRSARAARAGCPSSSRCSVPCRPRRPRDRATRARRSRGRRPRAPPRRARDRRELEEEVEDAGHGEILRRAQDPAVRNPRGPCRCAPTS